MTGSPSVYSLTKEELHSKLNNGFPRECYKTGAGDRCYMCICTTFSFCVFFVELGGPFH